MDEYSSSNFRREVGDRRPEIVTGKNFSTGNQVYSTTQPWSPDPAPPPPTQVQRGSQVTASSSKPWGFSDPEMKRKKRIAKYKVYTIEGRVKASIRNGIRWIKNKCSEIIHGY